jgi:hypothetical protein
MPSTLDIDDTSLTFRNYLRNYRSDLINKFIQTLELDVVNKIPNTICSSKVIYNLIEDDLDTNFKKNLFHQTFMEYFKFKISL